MGSNALQQVVIILPVLLDVSREVQQRLVQVFAFDRFRCGTGVELFERWMMIY
jgi:hypothetical protein